MKKLVLCAIFVLLLLNSAEALDLADRVVNTRTDVPWRTSFTPVYKTIYDMMLIDCEVSCDDVNAAKTLLPKTSYFRKTLDKNAQTDNEMIVHVYDVPVISDGDDKTDDKEITEKKYFEKPFKICTSGKNYVQRSKYKRIGGISTGLLVVPFKLRDGDLYGDSTIGPYLSYKWEVIELLATAGLSQISVSQIGTADVESKTGITIAAGINFEIAKDWDIAFLIGADHLSGDVGKNWEFQDKLWISFAIGFNFTR